MVKTSKYGHLDISKVEPICHLFDHIYLKLHFHEFFSCIQDTSISITHIAQYQPPTYVLKYFENKTPLLPLYNSRGEVQGHERFKPNDTFLKVEAVIFQSYTLKNKKLKNFHHHDATTSVLS